MNHRHNFYFLICSERSGSNFITKLFDSHPEICGPSPAHLLRIFAPLEHYYGDLNQEQNWVNFIRDVVDFFNLKISHWEALITQQELYAIKNRSLASIFHKIYSIEASHFNKNASFVKENHAYKLIPYYLVNFPDAKFIWSVRDPRDMALSWKKDAILRGGIVRAASVWKEDQKNAIYIYNTLLKSGKITSVNYEFLTQNTESEVRRLCDFLGINYYSSMLELSKSETSAKNANASPSWSNLNKGIIKNNSNKFLEGLSKPETLYIEYLCREEMKAIGYKPVYDFVSKPEFLKLQYELSLEEKFDKPEYEKVSAEEKNKRDKWMLWVNQLQNRFR